MGIAARLGVTILTMVTASLAACGTFTTPAAVSMSDGQQLVGTTTASLSAGTFEVSNPATGLRCSGNYDPLDMTPTISAPVTCNDGRVGTITVTRTPDGLSGSGVVMMSDGSTGTVAFGRLAAAPLTASVAEPAPLPIESAALATSSPSELSLAPAPDYTPLPPVAQSCCKVCRKGKACGDTCIARNKACHVGRGCACDG